MSIGCHVIEGELFRALQMGDWKILTPRQSLPVFFYIERGWQIGRKSTVPKEFHLF